MLKEEHLLHITVHFSTYINMQILYMQDDY